MSMMAYRAVLFLIFFNYSMLIMTTLIAPAIFPDNTPIIATSNDVVSKLAEVGGVITTLALTAGVLALFAFSLLVPTIPFVILFFGLSGIITANYIWQLPLPTAFTIPLVAGVAIIYYVGITQYAARSAFQGS